MLLEKINSPKDLKTLKVEELDSLSKEIRNALLYKISKKGGHASPNLGMVEMTVALHYVFDAPKDKIVFDVSHQAYTHKILTGRAKNFLNEELFDEITGFTDSNESEYDLFNIGHTSTSLSLACGLAKARDCRGGNENVIAVIGDGSLSGGEAYEGLNNIIESGTNMIVIVNDNEMSIAENHGGLYRNLAELRQTNGKAQNNFFSSLGFEYIYLEEGHNYKKLIEVFEKVKDSKKPVVVHIHTIKGKGYEFAEQNKETWHFSGPFDVKSGKRLFGLGRESYSSKTRDYLLQEMKTNKNLVVITSGTPSVLSFSKQYRDIAGDRFVDVGIAEEHAVAFASGIAKNGGDPVYAVYGTFLQRCYDQLSQDLCVNKNPATILLFSDSVYGMNDVAHLGLFDIPLISNIPNLVFLAPTCENEYFAMLDWSIKQKEHPVAIRVPCDRLFTREIEKHDYSDLDKSEVVLQGKDVAIFALGNFFKVGQMIAQKLKDANINATLINPRYISGIDKTLLDKLSKNHKLIITLEDGMVEGGFGQKIASYLGDKNILVKNYGIQKSFPDRYNPVQLLKENEIDVDNICEYIKSKLN